MDLWRAIFDIEDTEEGEGIRVPKVRMKQVLAVCSLVFLVGINYIPPYFFDAMSAPTGAGFRMALLTGIIVYGYCSNADKFIGFMKKMADGEHDETLVFYPEDYEGDKEV